MIGFDQSRKTIVFGNPNASNTVYVYQITEVKSMWGDPKAAL